MHHESPEWQEEMRAREERAAALAQSPELVGVFEEAIRDDGMMDRLSADPEGFLRERGLELPEGLGVNFLDPRPIKPIPGYEFFTFRLTCCRKVWVAKKDDKGRITGYEQHEICYGFEIIPHPLPGGPIA